MDKKDEVLNSSLITKIYDSKDNKSMNACEEELTGIGILTWVNGDKYEGEFVKGRRTGKGILTWANGDKYEGDFIEGKRTGKGVLTWANGDIYEGEFVEGKRSGKGTLTLVSGDKYEGDFIQGFLTGEGVFTWADGDIYKGSFVKGELHGKGTIIWSDGDKYEGDFVEGERTGKGTFTWAGGEIYEGDFIDGVLSGKGILTQANGDRYEGEFVSGKKSGRGILSWADGSKYEGSFVDNKQEGKGTYIFKNGIVYEGDFLDGKMTGKGIMIWNSGNKYKGDFVEGKLTGKGVLTWANGDIYKGDFVDGKRTGSGIMIWCDGSRYEGEFVDGRRSGKGILIEVNGEKYEGDFLADKKHGKGKYTFKNGIIYEGDFLEGKMTGKGIMTWSSGSRYEGDFVDGMKCGNGILIGANGLIYEGEFKDGKRTGNGRLTWANGEKYEGEFVDGKRTGKGIFHHLDGNTEEGEFVDGKLVTYMDDDYGTFSDIYVNDNKFEEILNSESNIINENYEFEIPVNNNDTNMNYQDTNSLDNKEDEKSVEDELNELIGLKNVKKNIQQLSNLIRTNKLREAQGLNSAKLSLHLVFTGNPGTGKTTVARIIGKLYKNMGLLKKGHVVEVDRSSLVAQYVGQTEKLVRNVVKKAIGGVLFIDEAYALYKEESNNDFGKEAIDVLLKLMEDYRESFVVIVAGYSREMEKFLKSNPGLASRFNTYINFEDYDADEMMDIMKLNCNKNSYILDEESERELKALFEKEVQNKKENFANARFVRNIFEQIIQIQSNRISEIVNPTKEELMLISKGDIINLNINDNEDEETLEFLLEQLDSYIGLENVKKSVNTNINLLRLQKMREQSGINAMKVNMHLVFSGNPGTGKTTIARLIGKIYKKLGLLSKGHFIECDRSDLVGQYVGQTSQKVVDKVNEALGGILFIDEAYSLYNGSQNDFGQEAIDTLLKLMEDNRDNLVVIVAGYSKKIEEFLNSNPGLKSRFNQFINFEDYNEEQLKGIFDLLCSKNQFTLSSEGEKKLKQFFKETIESKSENFANGRFVRNVFENLVKIQANRLVTESLDFNDMSQIQCITEKDIEYLIENVDM